MPKFKLEVGSHSELNADGSYTAFDQGSVVESERDLVATFGEKFSRVQDEVAPKDEKSKKGAKAE